MPGHTFSDNHVVTALAELNADAIEPVGGPEPEMLGRNGSYVVFRKLHQRVAAFRQYLKANSTTVEDEELLAAKMMGRWRSGAPLVLAPDKDDPALGADMQRNNNFNYKEMDPHGYAVPLGAHIRRMNPRDTAVNMNRRRIIRRGGTYGPPLPEGVLDDDGAGGLLGQLPGLEGDLSSADLDGDPSRF